jgi:hypothetical protein
LVVIFAEKHIELDRVPSGAIASCRWDDRVYCIQEGSDVIVRLLVMRRFDAFRRAPLSVRRAMAVIVAATLVSVMVGGLLITLVDPEEFPDLGTGCGGRCRR